MIFIPTYYQRGLILYIDQANKSPDEILSSSFVQVTELFTWESFTV